MSAYRKSDFEAQARHETVVRWVSHASLTEADAQAWAKKFPSPFYTPNIFVRIGLFLFGILCAGSALGLFVLMTGNMSGGDGFGVILLLFGIALFVVLEICINRPKPFFHAGLEEAALYGGLLCVLSGILILLEFKFEATLPVSFLFMGVFAFTSWRYVNSLLGALSLACGFFALFRISDALGTRAEYVLPMLVIILSALLVKATGWALRNPGLACWEFVWQVLRCLTLLTCYAGGNYFVVREMSQAMFHVSLEEHQDIPMALLFYGYTFAMPLFYIWFGLVKKERLFLNAGLVIFAMAVFTYKHYHHVMSVEMGLCLAGLALLGIAWFALRFFRTPRFGISAAATPRSSGLLNAESLVQLTTFADPKSTSREPPGVHGEGGHFGGGGSQGDF